MYNSQNCEINGMLFNEKKEMLGCFHRDETRSVGTFRRAAGMTWRARFVEVHESSTAASLVTVLLFTYISIAKFLVAWNYFYFVHATTTSELRSLRSDEGGPVVTEKE